MKRSAEFASKEVRKYKTADITDFLSWDTNISFAVHGYANSDRILKIHSWYILLLSVAGSLIWFLLTEADFDQGNKKCDQMGKSPSS